MKPRIGIRKQKFPSIGAKNKMKSKPYFHPQKVFLTGANGFLGKAVLEKLQREKVPTVCYLRKKITNKSQHPLVNFIVGELNDIDRIRQALKGCNTIIHCAGLVDFDKKNYGRLHFIHVEALKNLVKASGGTGIGRLVYVSSHWTIGFSLSQDTLCSESSLLRPGGKIYNSYQQTKFEGEKILKQSNHLGMDYVIVNPTQIWGTGNKNEVFRRFVNKLRVKRLFVVPHGGLNIVHVNDVAQGVFLAVKYGKSGERYILGGENITFKSLATKFLQVRNERGTVVELPRFPTRFLSKLIYEIVNKFFPVLMEKFYFLNSIISFKFYSSKKAKDELGYKTLKNANAIIKEAAFSSSDHNAGD